MQDLTPTLRTSDVVAQAQSLLNQVKADLNLTQGEVTMFIPEMPNVPPQNAPVMIAQANQAQSGNATATRAMGVCFPVPSSAEYFSLENVLSPKGDAGYYLRSYEHKDIAYDAPVTISVLQQPAHGILRRETEENHFGTGRFDPADPGYAYLPTDNYLGKDKAIFLVDFGDGFKVKVVYFLQAVGGTTSGNDWEQVFCGETGYHWKISSTIDANGITTITSVEYRSPAAGTAGTTATDTAALASTLGTSLTSVIGDSAGVNLNVADLAGAAVGQAVGSTITLDTNAAGNGWFIDTTPADNSEFLPTSNPNEWVAKEGSAAYGKMDMLSVLLHEYGHALGINHSANPGDYMAPTLTAGVRRLPSAEEMALMQQLVAQAKATLSPTLSQWERGQDQNAPGFPTLPLSSSFIGFLGLLRSSRYGGVSIAPDATTLVTNYEVAANPGFMGLDNGTGWNTQGSVGIAPSTFDPSTGSGTSTGSVRTGATLYEVSGSQTRLSQVFMLNPTDRFLTFTLSGTALGYVKGAPEDAFQVALLDANSGASLLGSDGQTLSDAFLSTRRGYAAGCPAA